MTPCYSQFEFSILILCFLFISAYQVYYIYLYIEKKDLLPFPILPPPPQRSLVG